MTTHILLGNYGADYAYVDPYLPVFSCLRDHQFEMNSASYSPKAMADYDCVVLVTDHDGFDYEGIQQCARLIVDTRGVYRTAYENVLQA